MRYARAWGTPGGSSGLELEAWGNRHVPAPGDGPTRREDQPPHGGCEFASETDAAVLRDILKVKDGAGGDYWWVERGACDTVWQGSVLRRERRVTSSPLRRMGRRQQ